MADDKRIFIFDTTLRDGEQSPGASLDEKGKLEIARQLADLGVDIIEAGFPISSPGDAAAVTKIAKAVRGPTICALARTIQKDIDAALECLAHAKRPRLHEFIATSAIHRKYKLNKAKEEILRIATASVKYARHRIGEVEFSPEDASRTEPEFLYQVLEAVIDAGATVLNIPDTVGYTTPFEFERLIRGIFDNVPNIGKAIVSVHCHDDLGLAVANSLAAVRAGARQVECTINGVGERAGNAALEEIVMAIDTRRDVFGGCRTAIKKELLLKTSRLVSSLTGITVQPNKAVVGRNAFSHESGIHQDGLLKFRKTYEIMRPQDVGFGETHLVLGKHSGRHALAVRLSKLGYKLGDKELGVVFIQFKELADKKKEIFDDDLIAMVDQEISAAPKAYALEHLKIQTETGRDPQVSVTIRSKGKALSAGATGSGPVDAAYKAVDKITGRKNRLLDYQIHSVTVGKDAQGEVSVKIADERKQIAAGQGLSIDVIEASVMAYLDAINKSIYRAQAFKRGQKTHGI
ncbi:MAG: 2-isopropylmalate synthase [Candidatus Omnitrophota bacterium]